MGTVIFLSSDINWSDLFLLLFYDICFNDYDHPSCLIEVHFSLSSNLIDSFSPSVMVSRSYIMFNCCHKKAFIIYVLYILKKFAN